MCVFFSFFRCTSFAFNFSPHFAFEKGSEERWRLALTALGPGAAPASRSGGGGGGAPGAVQHAAEGLLNFAIEMKI